MKFEVVAVDESTVTIWDGRSFTAKHHAPEYRATMTLHITGHGFRVGEKVELILRGENRTDEMAEEPVT